MTLILSRFAVEGTRAVRQSNRAPGNAGRREGGIGNLNKMLPLMAQYLAEQQQ